VLDQHFREYKEAEEKRNQDLKHLQQSKLEDQMAKRHLKKGQGNSENNDPN
jgi:hypothetical protein